MAGQRPAIDCALTALDRGLEGTRIGTGCCCFRARLLVLRSDLVLCQAVLVASDLGTMSRLKLLQGSSLCCLSGRRREGRMTRPNHRHHTQTNKQILHCVPLETNLTAPRLRADHDGLHRFSHPGTRDHDAPCPSFHRHNRCSCPGTRPPCRWNRCRCAQPTWP
jgi:hypothetical protein